MALVLALMAGGALAAAWPTLERSFEARTEARARAQLQGLVDEGLPAVLDPPGKRDAVTALATLTDGLLSRAELELLSANAVIPTPERQEAVERLLARLDAATASLDEALALDVWRPPVTSLGAGAAVEGYLGLVMLLGARGKSRGGDALWQDQARLVRLTAMAYQPRLIEADRPVTQPQLLEQQPEVKARHRRRSWTNPAKHRLDAIRYLAFLDDRARWARIQAEAARAGRLPRAEARERLERLQEEGMDSDGLLSTFRPPRPELLDAAAAADAWGRLARQALAWAQAAGAGPLPTGGPPVTFTDPFGGPNLRWRLDGPRAATLWSVGPDGVDDAGAHAVPEGDPRRTSPCASPSLRSRFPAWSLPLRASFAAQRGRTT